MEGMKQKVKVTLQSFGDKSPGSVMVSFIFSRPGTPADYPLDVFSAPVRLIRFT